MSSDLSSVLVESMESVEDGLGEAIESLDIEDATASTVLETTIEVSNLQSAGALTTNAASIQKDLKTASVRG